jgi:hypothetical protein
MGKIRRSFTCLMMEFAVYRKLLYQESGIYVGFSTKRDPAWLTGSLDDLNVLRVEC